MKTIIAGSRNITDYTLVEAAVKESGFEITEVVSGAARGVDRLGEVWADQHQIVYRQFKADWNTHGKAAGFIRNQEMADYAEALVAVWNGSRGTKDMITRATNRGLKVHIKRVPT